MPDDAPPEPNGTVTQPSPDSLNETGTAPQDFTVIPAVSVADVPVDVPGYELREEVGRGGMGLVYRAWDRRLNRDVAIKLLQERFPLGSAAARRFVEEAQITGQLQHPSIPAVHELGTLPDGRPFLAMKLIKGQTLDDLLKERSDPSGERGRFVAVFEQVCHAVAYAHSHGVIHRDLKPANIMVGAFGEVQVMDWGLAKVLGSLASAPAEEDPDATVGTEIRSTRDSDDLLTQAGSIMGTPAFMPPEQALGAIHEIDRRSDVFGLGGILAAILTGQPPFLGDSKESTRVMAARGKVQPCLERLKACGAEPELVELCQRCLNPKREERFAEAAEVAVRVAELRVAADERARQAELDLVRTEGEQAKAEVEARELLEQRKRRRTQFALAGALVLVIGLAIVGAIIANLWQGAERAKEFAVTAQSNAEQAKDAETQARQEAEGAKLQVEIEREKLARFEYGRTMQVAHQEWRDNNVSATVTLLEGTRTDLRGWEWHYLNRLCHSELMTLKGHTSGVSSVSWSPDGSRMVTGSWDQTAKVWDAHTGAEMLTLKGHNGPVVTVSWSPNGSRLVTGSWDKTAKVWNAKTGVDVLTLKGHSNHVDSVSWSPDGSRLVTGSWDKTAKVWDAETGADVLTLKGHSNRVNSVSWSTDGSRLATGSLDQTAKVWDARTGAELLTLKGHTHEVLSVSWSPDGSRIVTGSEDRMAKVWDAKTGAEVLTLKGNTGSVSSVSWSPDGSRLVTGSDQTAKVWAAKSGVEMFTLKGHTNSVNSVSWSPDGSRLLTGSEDRTAKVWDAKMGEETLTLKGHTEFVVSVSWSPDGTRLATGSLDQTAKVWDTKTGEELLTLNGHFLPLLSVSWSPDGPHLVTAGLDGTTKVWNAKTGADLLTLKGHTNIVSSVSWSPDGSQLVTGSWDRTAKVWNAKTGTEALTLKGHTDDVLSVSWSPDGSRLVTGSRDHSARVWNAKMGAEMLTLKGHTDDVLSVSWSPDGSRLVTGSGDQTAKVWDATSGAEVITLKGHTDRVQSVSWSPDGSRLVTGSIDQTAKVWDAKTGAEVLTLKGQTHEVLSVSWSPDGSRLVTGSSDKTAKVWDSRPFRESRPNQFDRLRVNLVKIEILMKRTYHVLTDLPFVMRQLKVNQLDWLSLRLEVLQRLQDRPGLQATADALEQVASDDSSHCYNAACVWSILSGLESSEASQREASALRAMVLLRKSPTGPGQFVNTPAELADHMAKDKDLDPLRQRADYQAFVASLTPQKPKIAKPLELAPAPRVVK